MPWFIFSRIKVKAATEDLHAQESKDNDKEEEQEQQRGDRLDGVEEGSDQVGERPPVFRNFEDSEESDTTEHRDSKGRHNFGGGEHHLSDTTNNHKAIKTVEQRYKVALEA